GHRIKTIGTLKVVAILLGLLWLSATGCSAKNDSPEAQPQTSAQVLPQVSVQLWSVKDDVKRDFKGTLQALAAMGFDGVEFAGEFGEFADDPAGLKEFLEQNNLKVSGAHLHFDRLSPENFDATVAFYATIGCDTLIEAMDERAWDPEGVHQVVKELNLLAEKLAPHDMSIGYHNHAQEFGDFQGSTYWDVIAKSTSENVILQLDAGWVTYAGKDPVEYVRRYPGRGLTTHYKIRTHEGDENITPIIGQDTIDWAALLAANIEVGGTRWLVVEQEEYPNGMTPLQAVKASKDGLDGYLARHRAP
ncbi:MAG: sugar phosphate isomerase/epimerase family protein, partial [Pseudomonadales bacterium]